MFIDVITMYADLKSKKNYTFEPKKSTLPWKIGVSFEQ